ncbi:calmodulin-binding receptor-like cytoplasmic kinase 2 [Typha angustifolia]|uniref:calmodulin-binding receptor-like cytoplasmic kinase 2 n=1 Tax=Typha angustifolia TaxID=59011 RepID=UPI003C2B7BEA
MRSHGSPFGGRKHSSGSRMSDPSSEFSRSSAWSSTSSSSSSSSRNPVRIASEAFRSCFSSPSVRSPENSFKDFNRPTHLTPSISTHSSGSNYRNEMRQSGKGLYASEHNNSSQMEHGSMTFTMADIQKATKNFSPNLKIGQGGSGTVYKGQLGDGTLVAIKRAKKNMYDSRMNLEFQNEIQTLQRIEHLNLVRYYGFLEHEGEKIIVVEYVSNGNLREHLDCLNGKILDFATRLDIAIDVAHAITYLHMYSDHPVIHRDIKSSNILLAENYRAKVADFGFAKFAPTDDGATHVSTQVKGTAGYLDPQYLVTYQLTEKSDVYSFGVLLVELVSGRRAIEPKKELKERVTAKWAMNKFVEGNAIQALDPNLSPTPATNLAVEKIFELSWKCLAQTRKNRPSMRRCAEMLWSIRKDYKEFMPSSPLHQPNHPRSPSPKLH